MGKRKSDEDLCRFVWKRDPRYDILLLTEVELCNPYAFKLQKPIWTEIAEVLQNERDSRMKVTDRSCRDRVTELLKCHRKGELASIRSSGTSDAELTALQTLLINVAKLEEAKPDRQLKSLYSGKDRGEALAIRSEVLEDSNLDSSDDEQRQNENEKKDADFEFGPKSGRFLKSNPKKNLINYLEKKNETDVSLRKEELQIRDQETKNKAKELDILKMKTEAEVEERKKIMELLVKLATPKTSQ